MIAAAERAAGSAARRLPRPPGDRRASTAGSSSGRPSRGTARARAVARRHGTLRRAAEPLRGRAIPFARGPRGRPAGRARRRRRGATTVSSWRSRTGRCPCSACSSIPESVLTPEGERLLANFLGGSRRDARRRRGAARPSRRGRRCRAPLAEAAFGDLMDGRATEAQKGAILLGIATRGETADEIAGAVAALRAPDAARLDPARAAARHLRSGRPRTRPLQPVDRGRDRRGGRRRRRRQARQPLDLLARRLGRRPRGRRRARSTSSPSAPAGSSTRPASCFSSRRRFIRR